MEDGCETWSWLLRGCAGRLRRGRVIAVVVVIVAVCLVEAVELGVASSSRVAGVVLRLPPRDSDEPPDRLTEAEIRTDVAVVWLAVLGLGPTVC